jgi:hypothetical protein
MKTSIVVLLLCLTGISIAPGQIIPIKTVPLATGNQFSIFPSANLASGGISVAADDDLLDPFTNPAKGLAVDGFRMFSAPQMYSVSIRGGTSNGSGISLPLGVLAKKGEMFGGLYWARQELSTDQNQVPGVTPTYTAAAYSIPDEPQTNTYTFASFGSGIPGADIVIGGSVMWGDLSSVEGVKLLFPRSPRVLQDGSLSDYRLGIVRTMEDNQRLEAVVVRSIFKMRYDVASQAGGTMQTYSPYGYTSEFDQTDLWGVQLRYTRPISNHWRFGALFVANWKDHPKIPNYDIMSIPRDPGTSTAYNIGAGLFGSLNNSFLGFDLLFEPIQTATWAEAAQPVVISSGNIFPAGMKTVENFFSFNNWIGRAGFKIGGEASAVQGGLQFHTIRYSLEQINHLQRSKRYQYEHWTEWTVSGGYGFSIGQARLLYTVLLSTDTGQPSVVSAGWFGTARTGVTDAMAYGDFLPAPSGAVSVRDATVWTHLVSITYSIN